MTLFLFLAVVALVFVVGYLSIQSGRMEQEIERLRSVVGSVDSAQSRDTERIRDLMQQVRELRRESEPVVVVPEPPPAPIVEAKPAPEPPPLPIFTPEPEPSVVPPQPARDWEALIGGDWANKAGVAVLVVGLALFLQYSLTHLGPAGRVGLGYLLGLSLLGVGLALENRDRWRNYARGLIGGGWAAVYFTSYAAHALPAARVIDNPVTASLLLLGVALCMVVHSLRYRSQTVTGLAYFVTFGTLALTPLSAFAVVAVIPLAASLIYAARRFAWFPMMALGQIAVYVLYLIHIGKIGLDPHRLVYGQIVLAVYWLIFEISELFFGSVTSDNVFLRMRFAVNAFALLAISLGQWGVVRTGTIWVPCFVLGAFYLGSAFVRVTRVSPGTGIFDNIALGGYEGAVSISAGLIAGGIYSVCRGLWTDGAWLLEAEVLFGCSLVFGRPFLAQLAGVVFVLPVGKLVFGDIPEYSERAWPPLALAAAAIFAVNRVLRRNQILYSFAAVALLCTVVSFVAPAQWVPVLWLVLAGALLELGLREAWVDSRAAAYTVAIPAAVWVLFQNARVGLLTWPAQAAAVVQACAYFAWLLPLRGVRLERNEANRALSGSAALAAISLAGMAAALLPDWLVAPIWAGIALLLAETGFRFSIKTVRSEAHWLMAFALGAGFIFDVFNATPIWGVSRSLVAVTPVIASLYYLRYRLRASEPQLTRVYPWIAALLSVLVVQTELDRVLVPIGWAVIGFVLLLISERRKVPDLRRQAGLVAVATFARVFLVFGGKGAIVAACPVIALFFASAFLLPRRGEPIDVWARAGYSVLASVLLASLLYTEVRGSLLTVAWGAQGLLTLAAGFPARERTLRFCGLATFLLCVFKLFFYDLSVLATPYRILSFLVLGVLLLGASGLYTRFRETIRQYF